MAGPWEKYAPAQPTGPWSKFSGTTYIPPEPEGTSDPEKKYLDDYKSAENDADNADGLIDKAKANLKVWQMDNKMEAPGAAGIVPYASPGDVPLGSQDPNATTVGDRLMGLAVPQGAAEEGLNALSNASQSITRAPTGGPGPEVMEGIKESLKNQKLIPDAAKDLLGDVPYVKDFLSGAAKTTGMASPVGAYIAAKRNPALLGLGAAGLAISPLGSAAIEDIIANKIMEARRKAKAGQ